MNRFHRRYCASPKWEKLMLERLLPDALEGVSLGDNVLELGPGPGLTTLALARTAPRVTAVEIDRELADMTRERTRSCGNVEVVEGDATALPFDDARYSSVVRMTMLHHLHDAAAQDRLFAEACRVLQPGGVLCGSDNLGRGLRFRLIHIGDTRTVVDPETLPARLKNAGFDRVDVRTGTRLVFRAHTSAAA
jgi:ubiquinone/menaquinone biosynthesis C-methylase UbiE